MGIKKPLYLKLSSFLIIFKEFYFLKKTFEDVFALYLAENLFGTSPELAKKQSVNFFLDVNFDQHFLRSIFQKIGEILLMLVIN